MRWTEHLAQMGEKGDACRLMVGKAGKPSRSVSVVNF
jgi:hypothetical protein